MLKPQKMERVEIIGSKTDLESLIESLHKMNAIHIIDFTEDKGGFKRGMPQKEAIELSEKLLKVRAIKNQLSLEDKIPAKKFARKDLTLELSKRLPEVELKVNTVVKEKMEISSKLEGLKQTLDKIKPLSVLPQNLKMDYLSLGIFVGYLKGRIEPLLKRLSKDCQVFTAEYEKKLLVAIFVPKSLEVKVSDILALSGFETLELPKIEGTIGTFTTSLEKSIAELEKKNAKIENQIEILKNKYSDFILASEEHLAIQLEKAEAPLRFATTDNFFVIDSWVPKKNLEKIKSKIANKYGNRVHLEILEEEKEEAPIVFDNPRPMRPFEFLLDVFSTPSYKEIDPTAILFITFPLFFGLMIGDVGYGLIFFLLGLYGLRKCKSKEWRAISNMLFLGGIFALIIGFFIFGEAFGMHFARMYVNDDTGELSHHLPANMTDWDEGWTWSRLIDYNLPTHFSLLGLKAPIGIYSKFHDVTTLLFISVIIGIVHLALGMVIGIYNEAIKQGLKHAILAKLSWLLILIGGVSLLFTLIPVLFRGESLNFTSFSFLLGITTLIVGIGMAIAGEGGTAILELPGLMTNILSYTRLTAVGLSKAGMALAFNMIAFEMLIFTEAGGLRGVGSVIGGILVLIIGHLMIFVLGIIASGLHAIRLQYVEFFNKFYHGGGTKFTPFGYERKYTQEV